MRAEEAEASIFGYTCVNDVTARDLQKKDGQWSRAKGFDTFCPVGPWIVPRGEVETGALRIRTFVNGVKKQDAPVSDMIFPVAVLIEHISRFMTLEPGDLIATGTPPGVGPLVPGDVVRVEIEGIGALCIESRLERSGVATRLAVRGVGPLRLPRVVSPSVPRTASDGEWGKRRRRVGRVHSAGSSTGRWECGIVLVFSSP